MGKLKRLAYSKRLCTHLEKAEGDEPGRDRLVNTKRMTEWLRDAGLCSDDTRRLFKALDLGDGSAYLSEFLDAIAQICDRSHDKDIILHHESEKVLHILRNHVN